MVDSDPRDTAETKSLPHNLEAEQDLLGALLYDNAVVERINDRLRGAHFYEPFHQRLFDAILQASAAGRSASPTLLATTLAGDEAFNQFGGLAYLNRLVERAPPVRVAVDFSRAIYDLAVRRDLIRIGAEIAKEAEDTSVPAADHLAKAEGALFALAETGEQGKGVATFAEALDGAIEQAEAAYRRDGQLTGLATDLVDLDQKLGGLHPSDLLILAGRPSMGKTALATNIAFNVAKKWRGEPDPDAPGGMRTIAGGRVFVASLEMSKEQLALRIVSDAAGVSNDRIRKGLITPDQFADLKDAQAMLRDIPLHIDETGGINIARLCAKARRQHRKTGLDLIVIDYLQLITTDAKGGNRVQEVSQITGALKALAKELNVPVLALSQLSRQVEAREDKRPMLSDLRESGSIEQDADCVMFVYRDAYYLSRAEPKPGSDEHLKWTEALQQCQGQAEVIIGKQRHGPIGTVRLSFHEDTTKFGNLARDDRYDAVGLPREVFSFGGGD
jgi:replicative DNA helicase